jgi:hypothetical protein
VVSVFTKETLEANAAEVIFAESLDFLSRVDLALAFQELSYLVIVLRHFSPFFLINNSNL